MAAIIDHDIALPTAPNHGESQLPMATPGTIPRRSTTGRVGQALAVTLGIAAACAVTAELVGTPGSRPSDLWTGKPSTGTPAVVAAIDPAADEQAPERDETAALEQAFSICARGADPLLSGQKDASYGDLHGNPLVTDELQPACTLVSLHHHDPQARTMATVVLGRIALENGEDGGWFVRRAEALAPDAAPVQLLRLQTDLAALETSQEPFNDVTAVHSRLEALGADLPAAATAALTSRIDAIELPGVWNDPAMVRHALFGTAAEPIADVARISFMQGITTACEAFGFKPNIDQSIGAALARLSGMLNGQFLLSQEPYADGAQLGRSLNCGGLRLNQAYQRIAEPFAANGSAALQSLTRIGEGQ
jgi:hypothetical protein